MFISTKAGGMTMAFPNVCKVPAGPTMIPMPLPSIGMLAAADASTCSPKVKIQNQAVFHVQTAVPKTQGDEVGTAGGVVSGQFGGRCARLRASTKVMIGGKPAVCFLYQVISNQGNVPGVQLAPSQLKVIAMS